VKNLKLGIRHLFSEIVLSYSMGSSLLKNQNELLGLVYIFHVKGSSVKFKRIGN
jgi:hypothetical protein